MEASRRGRSGNNLNGGMNTAIIEEDKNCSGQTNSPRQELYTTAFVTPLRNFKESGLPWPFAAIFDSLQELKWCRTKNETGFAVSAVCMAAIIFGSLTERTLLNLLLIFQSFAVKFIPYSIVISLFFWTGVVMRRRKWVISWKLTFAITFVAEIISEVVSKYSTLNLANIIGLVIIFSLSAVLFSSRESYCTPLLVSLIGATRFMAIGIILQQSNQAAGHPAIFSYFASLLGFSLGYLVNSSTATHSNDTSSDGNDVRFHNKIPVIRKRRGSSIDSSISGISAFSASAASRRRTSMPLLGLPNRRVSLTSVDLTTLGEAHGMIVDLLADASLPQSVIGALKVISDMLSPLLQQSFNRNSFSTSLVTVLEKTQVHVDEASVKDQPDLKDDTPLSLKNRLTRQLGVGVRRMSSSYTTTTSATGMPSLDIDYRRSNSTSIHEDRRSRSPSPSPKANRAKSYAGIYNRPEIRKEFIKSQSFCQSSPSEPRQPLLKGHEDEDGRDSIFKAELSCSDSNFADDNVNDNVHESAADDEIFEEDANVKNSADEKALKEKSEDENQSESALSNISTTTCNEDRRHSSLSDPTVNDASGSLKSGAVKADGVQSPDQRRSFLSNRKLESLNVAQVAPVRKNSRDESALRVASGDGYGSRRGSGVLSTPFTQADWQHELNVAASKEIEEKMELLLTWEFPIFELSEKCHILTQTAYKIFQSRGFFQKFKIPQEAFFRYFRLLESGYHDIPYHNQMHAADVLQGAYYLTNHRIPGLVVPAASRSRRNSVDNEKIMTISEPSDHDDIYGHLIDMIPDIELMALYTASAMHDFDHPGRTNAFLVATLNPKALLYNDRSVLENHHAAAGWALLLSDPANNFLCGLDSFDFKRFRFIVVEEILATDLKKHFDFLTEWNAKISEQGGGLNWSSEADRVLVGQMCIKLCDISGPSKNWDLHHKWTQRIVEEFYLQGDAEAAQGMPISPYMDRNHPRLPQLQDSFIKHLVGPLYNAYGRAGLLPGEWIESEVDPEDTNDDEENYDGSSQSYTNDSTSERSDDESDLRIIPEKEGESKKRKVIFCETTHNITSNLETWQKIINAEAAAANDADCKQDNEDGNEKSERQETITEEEECDNATEASSE